MSQSINLGWRSPVSTGLWNMKIGELIGANLVYKGFNVIAGTGKGISFVKGNDNAQQLYINGARITENSDLINIITIPDNSTGNARVDIIYAEYTHGEGMFCTYKIATDTATVPNSNCCEIAKITVPNNFSSASEIVIEHPVKMPDLNSLKNILRGTTEDTFQINISEGPILKNSEGKLLIRNSNDSDVADLIVGNLTVLGMNTSTPQQTITTGDNYILLNNDILPSAEPTENAGIKINRGNQTFSDLIWDEASKKWKAGLIGSEQSIVLNNDGRISRLQDDGRLSWTYITEKPSSSINEIDDAVTKRHVQNTDTTLTGSGANTANTTGTGNIIDFKVNDVVKSSIDKNGNFTGVVDWSKISGKPTATIENLNGAHIQNTDNTLTNSTASIIKTTGAGNIVDFKVNNTVKSSIDKDGNFTGSSARVNGKQIDQDLKKASDVTFKSVSFNEALAAKEYIGRSVGTGTQMRFSMSSIDSNQSFAWGATPDGLSFVEKMKLTSEGNLTVEGWINPGKVYNATLNDYAEWFLKGEENIEPGDVLVKAKGQDKYIKCNQDLDSMVVGVVSDSYAICVGGDKLDNMEDNMLKYAPVGLAGRVYVKVIGRVEEGDLLVTSSVPGHAMALPAIAMVTPGLSSGRVFAKAIESNSDGRQKVRALIYPC